MFALGWVLWRGRALITMSIANTMFIVMCLFDMLHFFSDPAMPMPFMVWVIEIVTSLIALGITLLSPRIATAK